MADFTLSKSLFKGKHRDPSSLPGNIAYAVFVLFCFWGGCTDFKSVGPRARHL